MFNANDYSNEELLRAEITGTAGREISESEMKSLIEIGMNEIENYDATTAEAAQQALQEVFSKKNKTIFQRKMFGRDEFMEFFRSDRFHEEMSPEDCKEIFSQVLHGNSDFSKELLDQTLGDYDLGVLSLYSNEDLVQELKERGVNVLSVKNKAESEINNYPPVEVHLTSFYKTGVNGISTRAYSSVDEIDLSDKYLFTMRSDFSNSLIDRLVNVYQNDPKIHINKTLQLHFEDSAIVAGRKFEVVNKTLAHAVLEVQSMGRKANDIKPV